VGAAGYGVHHPLCQTLVALVGTPHATTNAVVLPHSVRFAATRAPEAIGRLARALGERANPSLAAERVAALSVRGDDHARRARGGRGALEGVVEGVSGRPELDQGPSGRPSEDELRALLRAAL